MDSLADAVTPARAVRVPPAALGPAGEARLLVARGPQVGPRRPLARLLVGILLLVIPPSFSSSAGAAGDSCLLGNQRAPSSYIFWFYTGEARYALVYYPSDLCPCEPGVEVTSVGIALLYADANAVDCPLTLRVAVGPAVWDGESGLWAPGTPAVNSVTVPITVGDDGLHEISAPVAGHCIDPSRPHTLFVTLDSPLDCYAYPMPMFDGGGSANFRSWAWSDWDDMWLLLDPAGGAPGVLTIRGAGDCCDTPVAGRTTSWGALKSFYR